MNSAATPRVALIHALAESVGPINQSLERLWPEAVRMNVLDDSLSADLARCGGVADAAMFQRFEALTAYAEASGAQAVLFTCSAFGACIEAVAARRPQLPVLKPNEAMVREATASGRRVGLLATFGPTLLSMPPEFPSNAPLITALADGALLALQRGDADEHDRLAVQAALRLAAEGAQIIALAQFSLARAAAAVAQATGLPVLSTPDSAVRALQAAWAKRVD